MKSIETSGERYKVPTHDHILFVPNVDADGSPLTDEERSSMFTVFVCGTRGRHQFFDLITAIETQGMPGAKEPAK
jgi:hypothetical protein